MGLIAANQAIGIPEGNAPIWNSAPAPIFSDEAVSENYDLDQHTSGATSYSLNGGSAALPTGVTISGSNLAYDGLGSAGTTTGIIIDATNGDGTTTSATFSIVINATPAAQTFPIFNWYKTIVEYRGGVIIPLSNTRFWDKPTYPTSADSTQTTLALLESTANAAAPGDTIFLQDGTYTQDDIVITASGTQANPITIASETLGGADVSNSEIQVDGDFINVMGFDRAKYDFNGEDIVTSYAQRVATVSNDWVSDGKRNRLCYSTFSGKTENDQFWNIVGAAAKVDNRIDHNHFLRHEGSDNPSGGSEHGQVGQNQAEFDYFLYFDNNYCFEHLNDGAGNKTVVKESELISLKSSKNMVVQNVFKHCNSHANVRAGRECVFYANWFIGATTVERPGGSRVGGTDNLIACNYYFELNDADVAGESSIEVDGGETTSNREAADRTEVAFNTAWDCKKIFAMNRSGRTLKPTDVEIHSNALKEAGTTNVVWTNDSTTPNFGANVFGPNKGIADADVVEAIPDLELENGIRRVTTSGNCDGTSDAISTMGPIIKELSAQGVLVDILGNTIATTNADLGCIQIGGSLASDPVQAIIDASGHTA